MAHSLTIYYLVEHADKPVVVTTPDEIDTLIDQIRDTYPEGSALVLEVTITEDPRSPEFLVGIDGDKGVLRYAGGDYFEGCYSKGDGDPEGKHLVYYYVNTDTEFPANAEVPLELVKLAVREFLASGGERPEGVEWTSAQ